MKLLSTILYSCLLLLSCFIHNCIFAQKDTSAQQAIEISSSYKPVLKNITKINFSALHLPTDTSIIKLHYFIPASNLFYFYQPIPLKPLALQLDTVLQLGSKNYVKAGFGNYSTPYLNAGFTFGDGKQHLFGLYANYISSKGKIDNQDYSLLNVKGTGSFFTKKYQINLAAGLSHNKYSLYGYDHNVYNFSKAEVQQKYQDIQFNAGIENVIKNEYGISYYPSVQANLFTSRNNLIENTVLITVPVIKQVKDMLNVKLEAIADISAYQTENTLPDNVKFINNVFQFLPAVYYTTNRFNIHAGITPTWDNGSFSLLPNLYGEIYLPEKVFTIQAGIVGRYIKNTFRNLSAINPYIQTLTNQINTQEMELYGGVKAAVGKHFNFNAKAGFITYDNFALFINDTATDNKSFKMAYEATSNNLRIHGNVSYINQDLFTLTAGITLNGYTGFEENAKAWNTIPVEFTSSFRWWLTRQMMVKADLYIFGGSNYIQKNKAAKTLGGGTDLNIGCEFTLNKMFSLWADINNVFSNKYQRWPNYPVYGLNVLAGVRAVF